MKCNNNKEYTRHDAYKLSFAEDTKRSNQKFYTYFSLVGFFFDRERGFHYFCLVFFNMVDCFNESDAFIMMMKSVLFRIVLD